MSRSAFALAGLLVAAAGLSACGKVGELERPGPLFGAERNTTRDADEAQRQQDPSRPVDTFDPRDRTTDPAPAKSNVLNAAWLAACSSAAARAAPQAPGRPTSAAG